MARRHIGRVEFYLAAALSAVLCPTAGWAQCGANGTVLQTDAGAVPAAELRREVEHLEVIGTACLPLVFSLDVTGVPPEEPSERALWAEGAVKRVEAMYAAEGFPAARAWHVLDEDQVTIEVDEGRIHRITFVGANSLEKVLYSDNVHLLAGILYEPLLLQSLQTLQETQGLRSVTHSLAEGDEFLPNRLGFVVPERVLTVYLIGDEDRGWGFGFEVEAPWGLMLQGSYDAPGLLANGAHFTTRLALAFPVHQYVIEEEPKFRWVYGKYGLDYRFAPFREGRVSPLITARASLAKFQRTDLGIESVYVNQNGLQASLQIEISRVLRQTLGVRVENAQVIDIDFLTEEGTFDEPRSAVRGTLVSETEVEFDDGTLRSDLRDRLAVEANVAMNPLGELLLRAKLEGQWAIAVGHDDLLLRARGLYIAGDVRFYHERPLASPTQRVFFADRYWVREAGQVEVAYRKRIRRNIKLGLFHDLSVFVNRLDPELPLALANGGGPSLHLLLLDQFAFDFYYGVGLSPEGLGHNMYLKLRTVY
ncbi:MAG: hypothetical protein JRI25_00550 [Deltaproteobacteria bacterium]|nr:hypothetical protein [Deltaproteobacteria bacterium]MBW2253068.1 hypothetical protein [Deltaproteobacteria bacterium]